MKFRKINITSPSACLLIILPSQLSAATFLLGDNFFTTQGVPLNGAVSGVYDISTLSGVPGLIVTVSGNATRTTDNNGMVISVNQNVAYSFSNTLGGNATVDGSFLVGTGLFARESNQLLTNGTIANDAAASLGVTKSIFPAGSSTIIRYSNLSTTDSVVQSPHSYDALAGTNFNFSVNNLNGTPNQAATFIPRFTIESTPIPEPSSAIFLALSSFAFFQRKR